MPTENTKQPDKATVATVVRSDSIERVRVNEETPESWIRKVVGLEDVDGAVITRVRLEVRQTRHEKFARLLELPVRDQSPSQLVKQVSQEVENAGYRHVRVSAFFPLSKVATSTFLWPSDDMPGFDDGEIEDGAGLSGAVVRQSLRHNEVFMSSMMNQQVLVMRHLTEQNRELSKMSEQHLAERLELVELVRSIRLEGATEDVETKRNNTLMGSVETLTNAVALRLTDGKASSGAREDAIVGMLKELGQSLKVEQLDALQAIFSPQQIGMFYELMRDPTALGESVVREAAPTMTPPTKTKATKKKSTKKAKTKTK